MVSPEPSDFHISRIIIIIFIRARELLPGWGEADEEGKFIFVLISSPRKIRLFTQLPLSCRPRVRPVSFSLARRP